MSRAASVPQETDLLCEGCGYILNGLPEGARCPECGKPVSESAAQRRRAPEWEAAPINPVVRFVRTTIACIAHPTAFFRTLSINANRTASRRFARVHVGLCSILFGVTALVHLSRYGVVGGPVFVRPHALSLLALIAASYVSLTGITYLAARLTTWEATFRGLRLPLAVVLRAMDYHAAHYLPVAMVAAATVLGYAAWLWKRPNIAGLYGIMYLYVLCGEVVVCALYLFRTYWAAMRNLMYANR